MTIKNIPVDIKQQALAIIEQFNQQLKGHSEYIPRFKGFEVQRYEK